ncbi:N-acetyltransferase family protein [Niabella insulamsoli]|uniref:GNAT family N-acetyltransferase n=1 Tax=Niabella insulamsoli TaxID=3144874 RepID=UPI0031FCAF88
MKGLIEQTELRQASIEDAAAIWQILQEAIERRRRDGSLQWQDGYPNTETVQQDIASGAGYVLLCNNIIVAYAALLFNNEPAYENIDGAWLTNGDFMVVHRVAVSDQVAGKGFAALFFREMEVIAKAHHVFSIKVDTNFDNPAMLHILHKSGYIYCGEVMLRGAPRKAFEKRLVP